MEDDTPAKQIRLTRDNLCEWPAFQKLHEEGKIAFDKTGRLRYRHGAPVGDLILVRVNRDGRAIYRNRLRSGLIRAVE